MKATRRVWLLAMLLVSMCLCSTATALTQEEQSRARDAQAEAELGRTAPELVETWRQATAATKRNDLAGAASALDRVMAGAPKFYPAHRFAAVVAARAGDHKRARDLADDALLHDPGAFSERAMAMVLLADESNVANQRAALSHAESAARALPQDASMQSVRCAAAAVAHDLFTLNDCSDILLRIDSKSPETHYWRFVYEGSRGELGAARASLDNAHKLGLPDDAYQEAVGQLDAARPWPIKVGIAALWIVGVWTALLFLLVGAGAVLSRTTLSLASQTAVEAHPRPFERRLRKMYRAVLALTCAFYYLSIPFLALSVVVGGGGIILAFFAVGTVPVKLVLIIAFVALLTAWTVLKSVFVRPRDVNPGEPLDLAANPRLHEALVEVAGKIGTRPVDTVYLTPGTEVAVFERGGMRSRLRGTAERCLVLGAGVLDGMDLQAFKGVLAHEYGHFKNEDTAGGSFGLAVRRSIFAMAMGLASQGMATWYNPAWHFVCQFHKVFLRISHGATRLQEILADRWAAFAYGSDAFARGLTHVVRRSIAFDVHLKRTIGEVLERKLPLANLYSYSPEPAADVESEVAVVLEGALARTASEYDSHPAPNDRIVWVRALAVEHASDDANVACWTLFGDRAAIEARMTAELRNAVHENHGVVIPAHAEPAPEASSA